MKNLDFYYEKAKEFIDRDWIFSSLYLWSWIINIKPSAYRLFRYADNLRLCGFLKESEEIFHKINLEDIPDNNKYLHLYFFAQLYLDKGDKGEYVKAEELLNRSISYNPDYTDPYISLAKLFSIQERFYEQEIILKKALTKVGDKSEVNYLLALCFIQQRKYSEGMKALKLCLSINPDFPNAEIFYQDLEQLKILKLEIGI